MKLDSLVHVIQTAALSANEALHKKNKDLIDLYFEKVEDNTKEKIRESFSEESNLSNKQLDEIVSSLPPDLLNTLKGNKEKLVPKMVTIQYPRETAKGPVVHDVHVPLIALMPLSSTEISNIKFKTDLEIKLVDDELNISFPNKNSSANADTSLANLEINIDKSLPTEGLRSLVEGYEKALRAQIPG